MTPQDLEKIASAPQMELLLDRVESDLTSEAEKLLLNLAIGLLVIEARQEGWFELDQETFGKVLHTGRIRNTIKKAKEILEATNPRPSKFSEFTIGYFSSLAASLSVPIILGIVIFLYLLGDGVSITAVLELLQIPN